MRLRVLKAKHWLILTLLGMLGMASCSKDKDDGPSEIKVMYGCPTSEYNDSIANQ